MRQFAGAARFIYNLALEQRRDWWRQFKAATGRPISWSSQSREVSELRASTDWLAAVPRSVCESALRDLERAYAAFWRGAGFPGFRTADRNRTFRVQGRECPTRRLNRRWAALRLPKIGEMRLRLTRAIPEQAISVSVRQAGEKWFASFSYEHDAIDAPMPLEVGVDRGVANTITLSNGERYSIPASIRKTDAARRRGQRVLCRRKKGSRRRLKQRLLVAELHRRAGATRTHWLHERSTDIARQFGQVAIEKLNVASMTRSGGGAKKRGLNRSILEQGWSIFASMLEYKLVERGGTLYYVNPAYTSQTCSECGSVNAESRKSQAVFQCVECGHAAHADTNAAINILRRSPAGVEGAGYGPVEAQTGAMLTHRENLAA